MFEEFAVTATAVVPDLDRHFPRYTDFDPKVPVWCVTPNGTGAFHRFFDTSPISPSGRYLAFLRIPFEDRRPRAGEAAAVCLVDLETGTERELAQTRGWEPQMGANINWGADDRALLYNDVDVNTWQAFAWKHDPLSGTRQRLGGGVYHVSPNGRWACTADLRAMRRTQYGYGVVVPDDQVPRNVGPRADDGLWLTDTETGQRRLLLSIQDAIAQAVPAFELDDPQRYEIYGFHSKFNPQGDRLMFTLRFFPDKQRSQFDLMKTSYHELDYTVLTLDLNATRICNALPTSAWKLGGHHTTWFPDGRHLSMNLGWPGIDGLRFTACDEEGANRRRLLDDVRGSGHPTVHRDGRHLLTDSYTFERGTGFPDGTIPLRWVDLHTGAVDTLVRINTQQPCPEAALRVDPHPAWDRSGRWVTLNAFVGGTRRIFVADMRPLL
jgi:hypothetical protein